MMIGPDPSERNAKTDCTYCPIRDTPTSLVLGVATTTASHHIMIFGATGKGFYGILFFVLFAVLVGKSNASLGDHLPEFRECVKVLYPCLLLMLN